MAESREGVLGPQDQGEDQLRQRIRELEAEAARLREALRERPTPSSPSDAAIDSRSGPGRPFSGQYKQIAEILDASADAIISVDARGMINRFNRGAEAVFGYRSSEIIGRPLDILIPERFRRQHRSHMARFGQDQENSRLMNERGEIFGQRKDGKEFPAEASIVKLESGDRPVFTVILRDITERKAAEAAIRNNEALVATLLDNLPVAIHLKDLAGKYIRVNQEYERQFGQSNEQAQGRTIREMQNAEVADAAEEHDRATLEARAPVEREIHFDGPLGPRTHLAVKSPLFDADDEPTGILCVETDITERQRAQAALREREAQLRQAQQMARIGTYVWDETIDSCEYCSDELAETLGLTETQFMKLTGPPNRLVEQIHPDDRAHYEKTIGEARESGKPFDTEYRYLRNDGKLIHLREMGEPEFDDEGKFVRTFGTLQDITEIRRAEETLRQSEALLSQAQRLARLGVYVWDNITNMCVYCSEDMAALFGMNPPEFMFELGTEADYLSSIHEDDRAHVRDAMHKAMSSGIPYDIEYRIRDRNGKWRVFREITEPVFDSEGRNTRTFGTVQDITGLREAQEALRQSEEQFRSLIEGSIQGVLIHRDFEPVFINQALADMFGYEAPEEIKALGTVYPLIAKEERERMEAIADARSNYRKAPSQFEFQGVRKDGSRVWLENRGNLVRWGGETAIMAVMVDITERHSAQIALQENEKQLRTITDNLPAFIAYTDKDQRLQFANETVAKWYGDRKERLVGKRAADLLGKEGYELVAPRIAKVLAGKTVKSEETRTFPDGVTRHIDNSSIPNIGPDGEILGWFTLITDITERKLAEEALRQREEQLRAITDNVPAFIVYLDKDHHYRFANRFAEEWYARSASDIVGRHILDVVGEEGYAVLLPRIEAALSGESVRFEEIRHFPDGSERSLDMSYVPDIDEDGQVRGFFALLMDITDRRRAEDALRRTMRSADLLRQIATAANEAESAEQALAQCLEAISRHGSWHLADVFVLADDDSGDMAPAGLWWTDNHDDFMAFRGSTEQLRFAPGEGLPGRVAATAEAAWIVDVSNDGNFPRSEMAGGQDVRAGFAFPVLMGQTVLAVLEFFSREARKPDRDLMDIATQAGTILGRAIERQRAERALKDSEEHIRLVTDNIPVLITYVDQNKIFRFANRTTEEWYARPAADLVDQPLKTLIGQAGFQKMAPHLDRALGGETIHLEETLTYPDGKTRNIDATYLPHFGPNGDVRGIFTMVVDVTDRIHAEEQLRHAQRMEAIGKLTGGVAHDFNNLLAVIMGNSEIVRDQLGETNPAVRAITRAAQRGSDLTRRLLAFSRQQPLRPRAADLTQLSEEMAGILSRTLGETIVIEVKPPRRKWLARVDTGELENAILNLAINARDAMPDGGTLTISTDNIDLTAEKAAKFDHAEPGKYVQLSISDTGAGMTPDVAEHAFEPFYTTKAFGDGSGLGLSMVYGFATQSGGFASIESTPGEGTTVSIYLPRAQGRGEKERDCRPHCQPVGQGGTILVVEDDPDVRRLTVTLLRAMGYTVLEAEDGESALPLIAQNSRIDLLLSDVVLTGDMSGPAIAEVAMEARPDLRVLFMSGYAEDVIRRDRGESGKVIEADLLSKPFTRAQLAEKIRATLHAGAED